MSIKFEKKELKCIQKRLVSILFRIEFIAIVTIEINHINIIGERTRNSRSRSAKFNFIKRTSFIPEHSKLSRT